MLLRLPRRPAALSLLVACAAAALACGSEAPPSAEAVAPDPPATVARSAFGLPGPWWRTGATTEQFNADVGSCRKASTRARREAGGADPLDAAYRAFLGCMEASGWQRGAPPAAARDATPTSPEG